MRVGQRANRDWTKQLAVGWARPFGRGLGNRTRLHRFAWNGRLARKVNRRAFADPLGPFAERAVHHHAHQLVTHGPFEHAAFAQDGKRRHVQLGIDQRTGREPGLAVACE